MSEFGKGWKVLVAAFLGVMCGASPIPFNILGLLFAPLQAEFGWDRFQVSAGITVFGIIASLMAPVFGWLADRHGVRKVAIWSLVAFAASFAAMSLTPASLIGFYALWALVGLVGIGSTPVTWSRAISLWFVRNRGLALGIMLIGTSAAAFVVPQLAVWAIANYGWRQMFLIVAMLPLLVALPVALALFREPRADERPAALSTSDGAVAGMTFGEAVKTRQFWTLWGSIFIIAMAYGGAHIHMIPIVMDHGFDAKTAAGMMGIVGLGLLVGRIGVGFLLDRIWGPAVAFPVLCLPALACYLLMGTASDLGMISAAAFLLGFAAGAESDLIAFLAARYFGMAHFGRIYGMLYMPFGLMSAISPLIYGYVRVTAKSYDPILMAASVLFVLGGALLLTMGRYPGDVKLKEALA
ncbi:MFS transporter [Sphingomonas sp. SUN039]|uniref:MFS transporter n=1 Tax=Sphingomonas sp. SUN039 TaxID=2937787 RepID=UPI002164B510|nr:MFS transporter [Sphingomonas sp. SUN039]UVO54785.1 MFS transporter [Sphingomonas sp. SUN039]